MEDVKTDLRDVSFLIPVRIDSEDRLINLTLVVNYLKKYFHTHIYIYESASESRIPDRIKLETHYHFIRDNAPLFWRTRINNSLIRSCKTPFAIIYDTDVIICPKQLINAINILRQETYRFVLPYNGRFLQVDYYNKKVFLELLDITFLTSGTHLYNIDTQLSVGGCFACHIDTYKTCGMENEYIQGWGHDDIERVNRIRKLGYEVMRCKGPLYHLWHSRNENSYFFDEESALNSFKTYFTTCSMRKEHLEEQIQEWPWIKTDQKR